MEQIKDMVTLRAFALDRAIATFYGMDVNEHLGKRIIDRAKDIESYILGDAKLPESDNSIEMFKDALTQSNKPTPIFMWQNPSVILPEENQKVLVIAEDCKTPKIGRYCGLQGWEVECGDRVLCSDWEGVQIVAWLPIPQYFKADEI